MQKTIVTQIDDNVLQLSAADADRLVYSYYFRALVLAQPSAEPDPDDVEFMHRLLDSDIGYLFLDRTRIRSTGFALGEPVFTLSLAPGEQVDIEQKSFSKRETSYEDATETEQQTDLELSSTFSTELAEGLERENRRTDQTGFQIGAGLGLNVSRQQGMQASVPLGPASVGASNNTTVGGDVKVDVGYSHNVTEASGLTQRRSVKDTSTASSKVASRYRAMHKTTFRVATEDRFELGSKRTVKNPNAFSPIDLQYFKILRRLQLTQERYGVRLCWAPSVDDPAAEVVTRIALAKKAILDRALVDVELPPRPVEPPRPQQPPRIEASPQKEADKWGITGDMRADYDLEITIPSGYVWNGDVDEVGRLSQVWGRPPENMGWHVVGEPWKNNAGDKLIVRIHVGCGSWIGGPKVFMQAKAKFIGDPAAGDAAYRDLYAKYLADVERWKAEVARLTEGPLRRAQADAAALEQAMLANLDPVLELVDRIVKERLLGPLSDEQWEVELWSQVFEWERAGVALYPAWWSGRPARDNLRGPSDFLNASRARLYLPVRPGFERLALRWIVGHVLGQALDKPTEDSFTRVTNELKTYREQSFGDARETKLGGTGGTEVQEQFITLGRWTELLPTDGTHVEVVQAATSAVDDVSKTDLEDKRRAVAAQVAGEEQDVELKKKAVAAVNAAVSTGKPSNIDIRIATEDSGNGQAS